MNLNLNGSGVVAVVALAAGVVTIVLAWPKIKALIPKINPADRENLIYQSTGEVGLNIPDWFGGIFKSKAENDVDKMLKQTRPIAQSAPSPSRKDVVTPADDYVITPRSYYDLGQKPVPVGATRGISPAGVLTDSSYRDQVR